MSSYSVFNIIKVCATAVLWIWITVTSPVLYTAFLGYSCSYLQVWRIISYWWKQVTDPAHQHGYLAGHSAHSQHEQACFGGACSGFGWWYLWSYINPQLGEYGRCFHSLPRQKKVAESTRPKFYKCYYLQVVMSSPEAYFSTISNMCMVGWFNISVTTMSPIWKFGWPR